MTFDTTTSSISSGTAYLQSANPYISVDNSYWDATRTVLESFGFVCSTISDYYNTKQCVRADSTCAEIATYMPSLLLTTTDQFRIYPQDYLIDDSTTSPAQCVAAISTNEQNYFALGQPFFRAYNIMLNYDTMQISIYSNSKENNSPIDLDWSSINDVYSTTETLIDDWTYFGTLSAGTAL